MKIVWPSSDVVKSALIHAAVVFIGLFGSTATHWFQQLADWAKSNGHAALPGVSALGYAAVSAGVAAVVGLGSFLVQWLMEKNVLPGSPPAFVGSARRKAA